MVTLLGVTGVITQTVIITRVTTDQDPLIQDQTPGPIIGVIVPGLTPIEVILREGPVAVTVEAIPLPGEVLHQDRLEADPVVHPDPAVHLKGKIKIPG